jgi:hypothetical protein
LDLFQALPAAAEGLQQRLANLPDADRLLPKAAAAVRALRQQQQSVLDAQQQMEAAGMRLHCSVHTALNEFGKHISNPSLAAICAVRCSATTFIANQGRHMCSPPEARYPCSLPNLSSGTNACLLTPWHFL